MKMLMEQWYIFVGFVTWWVLVTLISTYILVRFARFAIKHNLVSRLFGWLSKVTDVKKGKEFFKI